MLRVLYINARHQTAGVADLDPVWMEKNPDISAHGVVSVGNGIDDRFPDRPRRVLLNPDPPRSDDHLNLLYLGKEGRVHRLDHPCDRPLKLLAPHRFIVRHSDHADFSMGDMHAGVGEEEDACVGEHPVSHGAGATEVAVAILVGDNLSTGSCDGFKEPIDAVGVGIRKIGGRRAIPGDDPEL